MASFSEVSDSIRMWSHYGSNHQGFCIEYELEKFDPGDAFLKNLYPLIYSHQLFDLTTWAEKLVSGEVGQLTTVFPLLGLLQKFEGWAYEKEWRYILFQEKPAPNRVRPMAIPNRFSSAREQSPQPARNCWRFVTRRIFRCGRCVCPMTNTSCSRTPSTRWVAMQSRRLSL
jgi:hypothetical protein